jgi:type IV pilus assembly protein PilC
MSKKSTIHNLRLAILLKIPLAERILFSQHLSMMIKAGMTEIESLKLIRKQIKSRGFGKILDRVIADVENGQFLSESLNQFKNAFGDLFINIIKLGEVSGTLSENLNYLAEEIKKDRALRAKVRSALIYPFVLLFATVGITGALIFFVLPKIIPVFSTLGIKLPVMTRILIATTHFILNYYLWIFVGIIGLVIICLIALRIKKIRYFYHRLLLLMPIVGKITIGYQTSNFTRTLGLLLKSGIKIVEAISISSSIASNLVYRKFLSEASKRIQRGETLYKYLEENPSLFTPTVSRMVEVGEKTGNLDHNLLYLAEFYENEVDEKIKNLSSVLEPILLIVMGLLVGFIAISIITPIYEVTQNIGR